ncbi:hypothetical protein [Shewanella phage FishSpeaker]|nr:hypothetical protein [Shewanella phage FishSpeaker]
MLLFKYYLCALLAHFSPVRFNDKKDAFGKRIVRRILNSDIYYSRLQHLRNNKPGDYTRKHTILEDYLQHLLGEVIKGDTDLCESNSVLEELFRPFKTKLSRMLFAKLLLEDTDYQYYHLTEDTVPTDYWYYNVEERVTAVKFWFKGIPEHSRIHSYLNKRKKLMFADNILSELFSVLEDGVEPGVLTKHYFSKCHNREQVIHTAKHLIQKHVIATIGNHLFNITSTDSALSFFYHYQKELHRVCDY